MDIQGILTFVSDNFTPLLSAITIISFVVNIIQYKTNRDVQYHLDSIYQSCVNTVRISQKRDLSDEEYVHILYMVRIQAVSALRSLGINRDYGLYDQVSNKGYIYRVLQGNYRTMLKVKEKFPNLLGNSINTSEEDEKSD